MRVVHYTRFHCTERWGGREQVVDQYCRGLRRQGIESEIYATQAFCDIPSEDVLGTPVRRFPYLYPYFPLNAERKARMDTKGGNPLSPSLLRALRDDPPDLVHLHNGARLGAQIYKQCARAGIPVVYSLHGGQFAVPEVEATDITSGTVGLLDWGKAVGWWAGARHLTENVQRLLCVGKNELLACQERGLDNAEYLPNGVDEMRFGSGDGARFREARGLQKERLILCCGRIDTQKNQVGLIKELGPVLREQSDLRLLLVGSTTNVQYKQRVEAAIREQSVADQVVLLGNLPPSGNELPDVYAACDLFVLPSVAEPFGIVILEAWAAKRAVVASRVDGVPFFVDHERNGILTDVGAPGHLRASIVRVLEDPAWAKQLGESGRATVEAEYTWTAITDRLAQMYNDCLAAVV